MLTISFRNSHFQNTRKLQLRVSHTYIPLGHAPTKRDRRSRFMNVDLAEDRDRKAKQNNKDFYRCCAQEKKVWDIHNTRIKQYHFKILNANSKNLPAKQNFTISNYDQTTKFQKIKTFTILTPFRPKILSMIEQKKTYLSTNTMRKRQQNSALPHQCHEKK